MPHVTLKLYPGRSEEVKTRLAEQIVKDVMEIAKCGEESVSVAIEEIKPADWPIKCTNRKFLITGTSYTRNRAITRFSSVLRRELQNGLTIQRCASFQVFAGLPGGRGFTIATVSAGRLAKLALECPIEGRFRFVSDVGGDFRDAARGLFERSRRQLKPPAGQVCHGRLGEIFGKALHQSGARKSHLLGEIRDRPRMGNAAMQQAQAFFPRWDRALP